MHRHRESTAHYLPTESAILSPERSFLSHLFSINCPAQCYLSVTGCRSGNAIFTNFEQMFQKAKEYYYR